MAITQVYTAVPLDVITAARWNNEFGNIYNNGTSIAFPLTKAVSFGGYTITLDQAGVTTINSSASVGMTFTPGGKAGTPGPGAAEGSAINIESFTFTDTATAGSGTAAEFSAVSIERPTLAAQNVTVTTTDAATLYIQNAPLAGTNETITNPWAIWVDNGAVRFDGNLQVSGSIIGSASPFKNIGGLLWSRDAGDTTNDILVAVGETTSDDSTPATRDIIVLASSIIGRADGGTWVVGTSQPKLDAGAIGDGAYYVWLIMRPDTRVVDILFSLSATAPTMPANYTKKRLIGYFLRAAATNVAFVVYEISGGGVHFLWITPPNDVALASTLTTSRRTDALSVPTAFSVLAHIRVIIDDAAQGTSVHCSPDETDAAVSTTTTPGFNIRMSAAGAVNANELWVRTSAAGLVASRANVATIDAFDIITLGFQWGRR